jgi:CTP synthase (UTP-ammonia lyase)
VAGPNPAPGSGHEYAQENALKHAMRIGLVGDYRPEVRAHRAIPAALKYAGTIVGQGVHPVWLPTDSLSGVAKGDWQQYAGFWCVPASPYASMDGALSAIRFAREDLRPFLGTCGGFQHALLEYARHVLGLAAADHAESNPTAELPFISPLSCSLVGVTGRVRLQPGSLAQRIYGSMESSEEYHCNYGLNRRHRDLFNHGPLKISGVDENGDARVVELEGHPFFMATLFQPELSALKGSAHPLIVAFVRAAARQYGEPRPGC